MTIGTLNVTASNVIISNIDRTTVNEAIDGSVHGYFWGSHKQIAFDLEWLSADDRFALEELRKDKQRLTLDTGEKYNVRLALGEAQEIWISGEPVYTLNVIATEVVT